MNRVVTVIVPAYNEENRIKNTISALKSIKHIQHIYVVNDGSKDKTYDEICGIKGINIINQSSNRGKGEALYRGLQPILKNSDVIVFADADLEESAKDIEKLIIPILKNETDVTIAKFPPARRKGGFGFVKGLAKRGVFINTGKKIDTALSGQRAFKSEVLKQINNKYRGYGVELGMIIDILNSGYDVMEVNVNMYHNETGRDLSGFIHRGKQFWQVLTVLVSKTISTKLKRR
ncbi:MAG TPA: glycosyltransferase family 2 protein [Clostridia bacterium]|nr:glycosyltransferase family 2 protein [Clostridia bacterium]